MNVWEKLKKDEKPEEAKVKVKRTKVHRRDLEESNVKIQESLRMIGNDIQTITKEMAELDLKSEEGNARYSELRTLLDDKNQMYSVFQKQQEQNLANLKKLGESGRGDMILKVVMVAGGIFLSVIGLGMERESPKVLKIVDFILKPFRPPMKF